MSYTSANRSDNKASVRVATTANITLSSPGSSIDGVSLSSGDRVLVKNQTTASQNGIYEWVGASSTMVRAGDFRENKDVTTGISVYVEDGTVNKQKTFTLTTTGSITVGSTSLSFSRLSSGGILAVIAYTTSGEKTAFTKATYPTMTGVLVKMCGGGGGGGGSAGAASSQGLGGCGGGGAYREAWIPVDSLQPSEIPTVGSGGTGGTAGNNNGNIGGTSSFGSLVTCSGGNGGSGSAAITGTTANAGGLEQNGGTGGDFTIPGSPGTNGRVYSGTAMPIGHAGGAGPFGMGSRYPSAGPNDGLSSTRPGGGGSGGWGTSTSAAGGNGADGAIIIYVYG